MYKDPTASISCGVWSDYQIKKHFHGMKILRRSMTQAQHQPELVSIYIYIYIYLVL